MTDRYRSREELLEDLDAIRRDWLRWSVERLQEEAEDVLGREEAVPLPELTDDELATLIGRWEPVFRSNSQSGREA